MVTSVYVIRPLKLGTFSVGVENYHILFLEFNDTNFSADGNTFALQKVSFISCIVLGATWRLDVCAVLQKNDEKSVLARTMRKKAERRNVFPLF